MMDKTTQTVDYERKREQAMFTLFEHLLGYREPGNDLVIPEADNAPATKQEQAYSGEYDADFQ